MTSLHWVVLAIIAIGTSWLVNSQIALGFAGICLVALVFALATSRPIKAALSVTREADRSLIEVGDVVTVRVRAEAGGLFALRWLLIQDTVPPSARADGSLGQLAIGSNHLQADFFYTLRFGRRGIYKLGPVQATHGDILALRSSSNTLESSDEVVVHPKVLQVPAFHLDSRRPLGDRRSDPRSYEDPTRPAGVRAYATGDPFKRIHWAASARVGTLMSKIYDGSSAPLYVLMLNLNVADYSDAERFELACTVAASMIGTLARTGVEIGLHCVGTHGGEWLKPDDGELHLERALRQLAAVKLQPFPFSGQILEARKDLPWRCSLLVVTENLDESAAGVLDMLKRSGCGVGAVLIGNRIEVQGSMNRVAALGASVAQIETEGDIGKTRFIGLRG